MNNSSQMSHLGTFFPSELRKRDFDRARDSTGRGSPFSCHASLRISEAFAGKNPFEDLLLPTVKLCIKGNGGEGGRGGETVKYPDREHLAGADRTHVLTFYFGMINSRRVI